MTETQQHCDNYKCPLHAECMSRLVHAPPCSRKAPSPQKLIPIDDCTCNKFASCKDCLEHDANIRIQTLDEVIKHFQEVMMYHPLGVTISTLESLRIEASK